MSWFQNKCAIQVGANLRKKMKWGNGTPARPSGASPWSSCSELGQNVNGDACLILLQWKTICAFRYASNFMTAVPDVLNNNTNNNNNYNNNIAFQPKSWFFCKAKQIVDSLPPAKGSQSKKDTA